jgi:hypothetical protein
MLIPPTSEMVDVLYKAGQEDAKAYVQAIGWEGEGPDSASETGSPANPATSTCSAQECAAGAKDVSEVAAADLAAAAVAAEQGSSATV